MMCLQKIQHEFVMALISMMRLPNYRRRTYLTCMKPCINLWGVFCLQLDTIEAKSLLYFVFVCGTYCTVEIQDKTFNISLEKLTYTVKSVYFFISNLCEPIL